MMLTKPKFPITQNREQSSRLAFSYPDLQLRMHLSILQAETSTAVAKIL